MITLEALQTLDAIERRGSFAGAAEELFRVPSAVSYTIQRLEEELGVKLFNREKQRAVLTPTGRVVLKQGRQLLNAAERLALQARQAESGWESRLRITVESILPIEPLLPLIQHFNQQRDIEIELKEEALSGSWEALADQRTDLLIGASGDEPSDLRVEKHPLGAIELLLCAAPSHPLARLPHTICSEEDLQRHRQVIIRDSARHSPQRSLGLLGSTHNLYVDNLQQKVATIKAGLGIGFLPRRQIIQELHSGTLSALHSDSERRSDNLYLAWRKEHQGKALRWFVDHCLSLQPYGQLLV